MTSHGILYSYHIQTLVEVHMGMGSGLDLGHSSVLTGGEAYFTGALCPNEAKARYGKKGKKRQ